MVSRYAYYPTLVAIVCMAPLTAGAADFATYRNVTLGTSTADVVAKVRAAERDVTTLHERPALLQQLAWRAPYTSSRDSADRDSVASILFSFVDNRLFTIAVEYDTRSTEGLTREDMIESLTSVYGPRLAGLGAVPPRQAFDSLDTPTLIARWQQGDTMIGLNHSTYNGRFGLVISSVPLETVAKKALAAAVSNDAREAPAREAARAQAASDAAKAAGEKTRTTNKATFKP